MNLIKPEKLKKGDTIGILATAGSVEDKENVSPSEYAAQSFLEEELDKVLKELTDKEERVIRLRYGLQTGTPYTLEEVGKEFNVTRERIRQIESNALKKLRNPNRIKVLKEFRND